MGSFLRRLFGPAPPEPPELFPIRVLPEEPDLIYAIGDVHGCLGLLKALERRIFADAEGRPGEKWIVMLGDCVDRGPDSAGVLDHLLAPLPPPFRRLAIAGNHEERMLDFLVEPASGSDWLGFGGVETLASYGIGEAALAAAGRRRNAVRSLVDSHVPAEHRRFIEGLAGMLVTPSYVFVHAGLRPGVPLEAQERRDRLWIRDRFAADYAEFGRLVVHGHTPGPEPLLSAHRINVDTGAYLTGKLSAVRLERANRPQALSVDARSNAA